MMKTLAILTAVLLTSAVSAQQQVPVPAESELRGAIADLASALKETYVFPETATKMADLLEQRWRAGAYANLDYRRLADAMDADLQSIAHDIHLKVNYEPEEEPVPDAPTDPSAARASLIESARRQNFCFDRVEHLAGNVGYLKVDCFMSADIAGATANAAMQFLSASDALIFDLRENDGGKPGVIQLMVSYLVAHPTQLSGIYTRTTNALDQNWTVPWVSGTPMTEVPVYVLTSHDTVSAGESFAYDLQAMKRATIVGETTAGGANPARNRRIAHTPLTVNLPFGRAVNPITGTNWEGSGVKPDVRVGAGEALRVAHVAALDRLASATKNAARRKELEFDRDVIDARGRAIALSPAQMQEFAGTYGPRRIAAEGNALFYQRDTSPRHRLIAVGNDQFVFDDLESVRLRFERDASGRIIRLVISYSDGSEARAERS